jgi:hypothetical protein
LIFYCVFGRFVTRGVQTHENQLGELKKKTSGLIKNNVALFSSVFFSPSIFWSIFYRVFFGVSQQGEFQKKTQLKKCGNFSAAAKASSS